jgi:hypothetical protein
MVSSERKEGFFLRSSIMAAVELTFDQILEAVRRWPPSQRKSLLKAIEALPTSEKARAAAQRLRGKYRMGIKKRQRMSHLLSKGNAGTLTAGERDELDGLVEEFERKTLAMAQTRAKECDRPDSRRVNNRPVSL